MLSVVLNVNWSKHVTNKELYGKDKDKETLFIGRLSPNGQSA